MTEPHDVNRTPKWVKVFGALFIIAVLVILILHLTGGGMGGH